MRLGIDRRAWILAALLAAGSGHCAAVMESPTEREVNAAVEKLKEDPNLSTERTLRTLKWLDKDDEAPRDAPAWTQWMTGFFVWLAQASRALVWVAAGLLSALLVVLILRWLRSRGGRFETERFVAPTHVRDLDIRPESLPADIGAVALALWERGEHRAALALLYRGLLSRLAHEYHAPIRDSSTEGDCLALAQRHLPVDRATYASRLIRMWREAVYGGKQPETLRVQELCAGFPRASDPAAEARLIGKPA